MEGGSKTEGHAARLSPFNHFAGPRLRPEGPEGEAASSVCFCSGPLCCTLAGVLSSFTKAIRDGPCRQATWCPVLASSPSDPDD